MGSSASKSKKKYKKCHLYKSSKHCCLMSCFQPSDIYNLSDMKYISLWYFNEKHEQELNKILNKHNLTDITTVIMLFLENYKSIKNNDNIATNYKAFVHSSPYIFTYHTCNKGVCPIWLNYISNTNGSILAAMCGSGGVGKSSLTIKFVSDMFSDEYDPTLDDTYIKTFPINVDINDIDEYIYDPLHENYLNTVKKNELREKYKDRQQITFDILDTAGDDEFYCYRDEWRRERKIFFLIFDVTKQETFEEIIMIHGRILRTKDPDWDASHSYTDFAMVAVGNKCDLRDDPNWIQDSNQQMVDMVKAKDWFEFEQIPYIETSAKTGKNVNFLFTHSIYEYWIQSHGGCMRYCK
eukprot:533580_1